MRNIIAGLAAAAAGAAFAQPSATEPRAQVPPVEYRSVFEGYRPLADADIQNWRKANDEVGAAGGHKGQVAGQGTGQNAPARPPLTPSTPTPQSAGAPGHGGHK